MKFELDGKTVEISRQLSLDDSVSYESAPVRLESPVGEGFLVLSFEATFGFEYQARLFCGYESFGGKPLGRLFMHEGEEIGYSLTFGISVGRGGGPTLVQGACVLQKARMPSSGPFGRKPAFRNEELETTLLEAWRPVLADFIADNARGVKEARKNSIAAFMRELDKDVAQLWGCLSAKIAHRDAVRRAIHDPAYRPPQSHVETPAGYELREFQDETLRDRGLDEVLCNGVSQFHAETMSDDGLWIGVTLVDGRRVSINVTGRNVEMRAEMDDDPSTDVPA